MIGLRIFDFLFTAVFLAMLWHVMRVDVAGCVRVLFWYLQDDPGIWEYAAYCASLDYVAIAHVSW
jgi:hypothetical protein